MNLKRRIWMVGALLNTTLLAHAQFRVDVSGVGMQQIPIALAAFKDEPKSPQPISQIIRADLERSGLFRGLAMGDGLDENSRPEDRKSVV